jgi:hypothetical protein
MNKGRDDAEVSGFGEDRISAEAGRNEAERFRRLAEEAREVRDHHREALETIDRNESGCGTLLRRRGSPARKHGRRPRRRALKCGGLFAK